MRQKLLLSVICYLIFFTACTKKAELSQLPSTDSAHAKKQHTNSPQQVKQQGENTNSPQQVKQQDVDMQIAKSTDIKTVAVSLDEVTATVIGTQTSQLSFRVSGYISEVLIKNGEYVNKGQAIAKLDSDIFNEQYKLAQLALEQAQSNNKYANLTLDRTIKLNQRQATTQIALEQAEAAAKTSEIALKQAEAQLKLAAFNLNYTTLTAPYDGYIFNLNTWVGSYVSSTSPVLTITSIHDLQVQIPIPQTILNNFRIGETLQYYSPAQHANGDLVITSVIPYVDPTTKTYLIAAKPTQKEGTLMAGALLIVKLKK